MLHSPFDEILGTTSKVRIMRVLCEQDRSFSARELERLTRTGVAAVLRAVADLEALGVLSNERASGQFICRANREHALFGALQSMYDAEANATGSFFASLRDALAAPRPLAAWVFGSAARRTERAGSDVDLFVVVARSRDVAPLENVVIDRIPGWRRNFGHTVSPLFFTLEKAVEQLQAGNPLIRTAVSDARPIIGDVPLALSNETAARPSSHDPKNQKPARR